MDPSLNGSITITGLAFGLALSGVLNMYLLWGPLRRPNRVHPIGDKDTKSPAKVIKKKEKSPKVQKPKKPTRAERRKARPFASSRRWSRKPRRWLSESGGEEAQGRGAWRCGLGGR